MQQEDQQEGLRRPLPPPGWEPCEEPATPTDFGSSFEAPEHKDRLLQVLHPHPLDQRIVFYPGPHEYRVDGLKTTGSVTGLVHSFVEEFDGDGAIAKMAVSRNWPRPGYLRRPPPPEAVAALEELDPALGAALREPEMDEHLVSGLAQELKQRQRSALPLLAKLALSPDEIRQKWKANAEDASNRGTWMHLTFELWLNRDPVPMGGPEMALFQKFVRTLDGLTAYRTEWEIWGLEENLAGSIDFVAQAEDGSLVLMDWKRCKCLRDKFSCRYRTMSAPLDHLDDCSGEHYRLQLNCYRYLLEKYYGHKVSRMMVVCTHADNGDEAFVHEVPLLEAETNYLMWWQRRRASPFVEKRMLAQLGRFSDAAAASGGGEVVAAGLADHGTGAATPASKRQRRSRAGSSAEEGPTSGEGCPPGFIL